MNLLSRYRLHLLAFVGALLSGLACDVAVPGTTSPTAGAVTKAASGAACPEWGSGSLLGGSYTGDAQLNADIAAFLQASADIQRLADQSYTNVTAACLKMGRDLGVPDAQMQAQDGDTASPACKAVAAKIDQIIKANAAVKVNYEPPRCQMDANFKAKCEADCGVEVDPGKVVAQCEPAQLSGYCQGTCGGQCEGTCTGECSGECSARDAEGRCVGECSGTCTGQCSATCHAKCEGQWKAPRCETEIQESKVKAECSSNCEASANVRASCQPPKLDINADAQAEAMQTLTATLKANLPTLLQAQVRLGRQLAGELKVVADAGNRLRGELGGAGAKAGACVAAAVTALGQATAKINVSVQASASVSGKVGASAGTG